MPDMSLVNFIGHLAGFQSRLHEHMHKGLEHAARIVETEARREIGKYQEAAGPFAGWAELSDATKDNRVRQGFTENDPGLRTGAMRDSIDHAVGHEEAVVGSNDDKLVWFELGTEKQPPRSVLGTAAVHKQAEVAAMLGGSVVTALTGQGVHVPIMAKGPQSGPTP